MDTLQFLWSYASSLSSHYVQALSNLGFRSGKLNRLWLTATRTVRLWPLQKPACLWSERPRQRLSWHSIRRPRSPRAALHCYQKTDCSLGQPRERRWRQSDSYGDFILFKDAKNRATFVTTKAQQNYYTDLIQKSSCDQRKLFRSAKSVSRSTQSSLSIATTTVLIWQMKLLAPSRDHLSDPMHWPCEYLLSFLLSPLIQPCCSILCRSLQCRCTLTWLICSGAASADAKSNLVFYLGVV